MAFQIVAIILAGILSVSDYVTEHIFSKKLRTNQKLVSFSAGVAIAYLLLHMFPEIASNALIDGNRLFLFALLGFVSLNLIEQYIYKEIGKLKRTSFYHKGIHVVYFFVYNFLVGAVLVVFAARGLKHTLLFFVPFLLYIIAEILPQEFEFRNSFSKIFFSMAPVIGAIISIYYIDFIYMAFGELISFIAGTLLYIVIRESLPSDKAEKPLYFMIGVLLYTLVIFMSWNLLY